MAKFTFIVGIIFILNTVALGYFYNQDRKVSLAEENKIEKSVVPATPTTSVPVAPAAPEAPTLK